MQCTEKKIIKFLTVLPDWAGICCPLPVSWQLSNWGKNISSGETISKYTTNFCRRNEIFADYQLVKKKKKNTRKYIITNRSMFFYSMILLSKSFQVGSASKHQPSYAQQPRTGKCSRKPFPDPKWTQSCSTFCSSSLETTTKARIKSVKQYKKQLFQATYGIDS